MAQFLLGLSAALVVQGSLPAADLYGALWTDAPPEPGLSIRGQTSNLPLYGGIPLYADTFKIFERNDRGTDNIFHDRDAWTRRFEEMEALRLNALVLIHPHPFHLFIDHARPYEEASWLNDDERAEKQRMMRWLIAEGKRRGVSLHFLIWNIWLPRGLAEAWGIPQHGVDSERTRAYMRWTVQRFFETYPDFGGVIPIAGETPPGCWDFVLNGLVPGMEAVTPRPQLTYWTWCSYPWETKKVVDAYDGPVRVMTYLQYEQFFAAKADPRIGMYSRDLGGASMVALGGPKSSLQHLLFANPRFIRDILADLKTNRNGGGMLFEATDGPMRWMARLAFARSCWGPTEAYDPALWKRLAALRYGSEAVAGPFLRAMEPASLVVPTQLELTHSQSDHFMLQPGLFLYQALGMPTISTYVFENEQRVREDGYLASNLGLSRPNPDWGKRVAPLTQWAIAQLGETERGERMASWMEERCDGGFAPLVRVSPGASPLGVIARLESVCEQAERGLDDLEAVARHATEREDELAQMIELARTSVRLGRHLACKDRAAWAWERLRVLGDEGAATECVTWLEKSLEHWRAYAGGMDRRYPVFYYWESELAAPPPWEQNDFWFSYAHEIGPLSARTPLFERELAVVQERLAEVEANPEAAARLTPPLFDDLQAPLEGETVAVIDFEDEAGGRYRLVTETADARITEEPELVLEGERSLYADSRGSEGEWHTYFATDPGRLPLEPDTRYQVVFRYRVQGEPSERRGLTVALRSETGGVEADAGSARQWGKPSGVMATRVFDAATKDYPDYYFWLGLKGEGAVVVDDIRIVRVEGE